MTDECISPLWQRIIEDTMVRMFTCFQAALICRIRSMPAGTTPYSAVQRKSDR